MLVPGGPDDHRGKNHRNLTYSSLDCVFASIIIIIPFVGEGVDSFAVRRILSLFDLIKVIFINELHCGPLSSSP